MNDTQLLALALAVVPCLLPFLGALYQLLVSHLPANKRAHIADVIHSAVNAAEQVYGDLPGSNQAKREFVVSRVQALFGKRVSPALIEVFLEEAVHYLPHTSAPTSPSAI